MNGTRFALAWTLVLVLCTGSVLAQETDWPRTVAVEQGTVTLYEPQVEDLADDALSFRAALAWRPEPGADPVFGVGWFEAEVVTNRFAGTVHPVTLRLTRARFPADAPDVEDMLADALARPRAAADFNFSLAALEDSLAGTRAERAAAQRLGTRPPRIIYRDRPALLVTIDGEPILREIENSPLEAVINTPYPLIHDGRHYWLNVADGAWYRARKATGPYAWAGTPPPDVAAVVRVDAAAAETARAGSADEPITARNAPEIVVSTEPAELIVTEGPAAFVPLVDDLLVLQNSSDDVFMHVSAQQYYVVLSGRWYRAPTLNGPWSFHAADELPPAFAAIPLDSDQADTRVHVAGTDEAEEAVLDAHLPQAAAVARGAGEVEVEYDGRPEFARVDGTDLVYARNTGSTVIRDGSRYYLVDDGVWYVSSNPYGPWDVAIERPGAVRAILPSSPVYPVKYVYIYDYTPDVVYVGYTPGYVGSYVHYRTVFYGSGWYYRPWISPRYYYPRHSTWGFHVSYNPWSGWGFGLSWYGGPFSVNFYTGGYWHHHHRWYHRHYSYWGPCGYRPSYGHYGHRRPGHGGHRPVPYQRHSNLYRDERQHARVVRTRDRIPHTRDVYRPDVKAARQASYRSPGAAGKQRPDARFAKGARPAPVAPVRRAELTAKARDRELAYKAPRAKQPPKARRELRSETVADLGKLRVSDTARRGVKPVTKSPGGAAPVANDRSRTKAPARARPVQRAPAQADLAPRRDVAAGKASRSRTEPVARSDRGLRQPTAPIQPRVQVQRKPQAPASSQRQPRPTYRYTAPKPPRSVAPASVARTPQATPAPRASAPPTVAPPRPPAKADRPAGRRGKPERP